MSTADPGDARWPAILDDFEVHIAGQRAAVAAGAWTSIAAFRLPSDLGPVPPALSARLRAAKQASKDLESSVALRRDELGRRIANLPRRRRNAARYAASCYLDTTA